MDGHGTQPPRTAIAARERAVSAIESSGLRLAAAMPFYVALLMLWWTVRHMLPMFGVGYAQLETISARLAG